MIRYALLEATNTQWVLSLERAANGILLAGIAANFVLAFWRRDLLGVGFGVGLLLSFSTSMYANYAFYNLVRCPACGDRLNRFKNGKKVPNKQAFTQLRAGNCCRHCGWAPSVGA